MAVTKRQVLKVALIVLLAVTVTAVVFLMVMRVQIFAGPVFYLKFDHVGSLTTGAVVRTAGVRIGTVTDISVNRNDFRTVIVTVTLYPNEKVRKGSRFLVMSGSLIGDQYIEVIPVAEGDFIHGGETFTGEPIKNLDSFLLSSDTLIKDFTTAMSTLAEILTENKDAIHQTIDNIKEASAALKGYMIEDASRGPSVLTKLSTLLDSLERSSNAMAAILQDMSSKDSVITLLNKKETADDMKATLRNLKTISENLNQVAGDLEVLMRGVVGPSPSPKKKQNGASE